MIKAVVFDFGGVIAGWRHVYEDFLVKYQLDKKEFWHSFYRISVASDLGRISWDQFLQNLTKTFGLGEKWKELRAKAPSTYTKIEPVFTLLAELKGKYRLALLSNCEQVIIDEWQKVADYQQYFELMVVSSQVGLAKPNPRIFQLTCQRLNLKPQGCLFVDDMVENIEVAKKLGFKTVHFTDPENSVVEIRKVLGLE